MEEFGITLLVTLKLAFLTTVILLLLGVPVAYFISNLRAPFRPLLSVFVSLPLVLPPTVIGYYLLVAFSPAGWLGSFVNDLFNFSLAFTFEGILLGSLFYSLPFMVNPILSGFDNLPQNLREAAYSMGKGRLITLLKVLIPNIKPAILSGIVITFAHTMGEFGIVLMIGGSIPGETKVASVAIYNSVDALNYSSAHTYSLILFGLSFFVLFLVYFTGKKTYKAF